MGEERLRIVASLIRTTGDWDLAEDALADAAERALTTWPRDGVPDNPAAWLTTTARRRAVDLVRRAASERRRWLRAAELPPATGTTDAESDNTVDNTADGRPEDTADGRPDRPPGPPALEDDRLRLVFTCCHPALPLEGRVALTLKVVAGLTTAQVARAFLVTEATMGQRLLRAKTKIAHAAIPYATPPPEQLAERLDGVLAVVYLTFTQGYVDRPETPSPADEAIRLGRLLVELVPDSEEVGGLLALMLLQHSRRDARVVDGDLVTLEQQDRTRWDRAAITEALSLLPQGTRRSEQPGPYRLQAELAAVHATARDAAATDWPRIVGLYDALLALTPTPVVALNRAVAVGLADGPQAGLAALDEIADLGRLEGQHPVHAVRGELLARAGRLPEAADAFRRAVALAPTPAERRQIGVRLAEVTAR